MYPSSTGSERFYDHPSTRLQWPQRFKKNLQLSEKTILLARHTKTDFQTLQKNVRSASYKIKDSQRSVLVTLIRQICQWSSSAWTWWDLFIHPAAEGINMC